MKDIELFLRQVVSDKMYWTREILSFFLAKSIKEVKNSDIKVFLNFHQVYKFAYQEKMKEEAFEVYETTGMERAGSYWQPAGSNSMDHD